MFVPSLSWYNDRFNGKTAQKDRFYSPEISSFTRPSRPCSHVYKTNMDMQTGRPHIAQQNKKELLPAEQEAAAWPPLPIYSAAG
jgi:hypothetical protein